MSVKIFVAIVSALLLIGSFSGCTLLQNTEFTLISSNIVDDDGFVALRVEFNLSDTATIRVCKPSGLVIFSEEYHRGVHTAYAYLDEFKQTPTIGTYKLKADDENGNTIYENTLDLSDNNITIHDIFEYWWKNNDKYYLVGLKISLKNNGEFPIYPCETDINLGDKTTSGYLFPGAIMPFQIKDFYCSVNVDITPSLNNEISVAINNIDGETIAKKSYNVYPDENINDLRYNWRFIGARELVLPDLEFLYDYQSNLDRLDTSDYAAYEFDHFDNHLINMLTNRLQSEYNPSKDVAAINFIASFVQNIQYVEDSTECDYPRYPIETLVDRQGDCEDKAILTAAILNSVGYNVSLIQLPKHVAVGIHLDEDAVSDEYFVDEYYFLETSSTGWFVGKVPPEHKSKTNITVYTLESRPVLIHSWKNATRFTDSEGSDYIKMKILAENLGVKSSAPFEIRTSFFNLNGVIENQKTTYVPSISAGNKRIVDLTIDVPQEITTKLKSQIFLDNKEVHQRESLSTFP